VRYRHQEKIHTNYFGRYKLAEKLSERLDDMGRDLSTMIEEINSTSASLSKTDKADKPVNLLKSLFPDIILIYAKITQIVRILNSHLAQLQQIDQGTASLQTKITAAQRSSRTLTIPDGSIGVGNDAADDFHRSYFGRR
jgi:nuclear pore complex protein Nup62